jgi:hypothetical protein
MSIKIINITVPGDAIIPDVLSSFSPEENYMMLKIGSETLSEGRKVVANLTSDEIFKKVRNDFDKDIEKLNSEITIERKTSLIMNEKLTRMYETQIEQLNKKFENALSQIEIYKQDNSASLNEELNKVKNKYDLLLEEKDRQNQLNRDVFDKAEKLINKTSNKSSISIGDDGEQIFENLSDTFKDFTGYKIENKAKQGHKGDFHLFFKDFNILVDSKNYSGSVQKKEITKIESDLTINDNMDFAWMVSLNSNICDYNRFPIMTKWITTDVGVKCILFINNLLEHKDPRNILRQAWSMCEDFYKLTKSVDKEDGELEEYREKNLLCKKHINNLQERASEIRRNLNTSFNILKHMDNDLLEMLSNISDNIVNEKLTSNNKIKEWWDDNIEYVNDESKMSSTEIWNKFKKDNKEYVGENKITIESFKSMVTCIISSSNYVEKSKNIIEFIGFKWKQIEVKPIDNLEVENIIIEKVKKEKPVKKEKSNEVNMINNLEVENIIVEKVKKEKPVKKGKSIEFYFDEYKDKKILEEYDDIENDIINISLINNIRPWQIVSLLVRYKVILKRDEARGYDKYKETDEYKNKLNKC